MEPLSVGVHSVSTLAQLKTGQTIAVWGAGPVGLLCMAVAKALGASRIIAVDINQARSDFAKSYAATDVFVPPASNPGEDKIEYSKRSADALKKALGVEDRGPTAIDVVIEASGAEVSIQTALFVIKAGGTYVQVGQSTILFLRLTCLLGWDGYCRSRGSHHDAIGEGTQRQGFLPIWSKHYFLHRRIRFDLHISSPAW